MANWIITDSVNLRHPMVNTQGTAAEVLMLPLDNKAHTWQVVVRDGYADADLTGKSCYAYFARNDNAKVLVNGTITGNVCSVTLDSTCYAIPGFLRAVMIMSDTEQTVAIYEKTFRVNPALPGQTVDPGEILPSIDDLLAEIGAMRLATADANAAANAAQSATTAANTAAQTANTNANAAQTAANNANQATTAANQATTAANTAAQNANTKADAAQSAANNAYQAATSATEATSAAQTATNDANEAAQNANEAASTITTQIDRLDRMDRNQNGRLTNIESVTEGFLYDAVKDSDTAYSKTVPDNTLPFANLDMVGGKTLVWNQRVMPYRPEATTAYGITTTVNADGTINFHGTVTSVPPYEALPFTAAGTTDPVYGAFKRDGRKYLFVTNTVFENGWGLNGYNSANSEKAFIWSDSKDSDWNGLLRLQVNENDVINVDNAWFAIYDLRMMFGAEVGDAITNPEQAFALGVPRTYQPYSVPTLMNFSADKVVSKGKNLVKDLVSGYPEVNTFPVITEETNNVYKSAILENLSAGTYTISFDRRVGIIRIMTTSKHSENISISAVNTANTTSCTFALDNAEPLTIVSFRDSTSSSTPWEGTVQFERGNSATDYIPYFESINDLSPLVSKYFPDGMKSVGDVYDSFEKDDAGKWWAVQRVGSVDLGTLTLSEWNETISAYPISSIYINNIALSGNLVKPNFTSQFYRAVAYNVSTGSDFSNSINVIASTTAGNVVVKTGGADIMPTGMLYYELANYIRTEVTDSFPYSINVETGGTITFVNDQGVDYHMPLPNAETWKFNLGSDVVRYDTEQSLTDAQKTTARNNIGAADKDEVDDLQARVSTIENMDGLHRYGVTGIGLADTQLTRLYDAVGMTAQVGTDGDNSSIINNFDDVAPFNRRKCVGEWSMYEGKPVFHVNAYYGDPDYTEDGSMGDYVAVDCTPAYYMYDKVNGTLVISAHHYEGYRPFDCLMDRTTNECRPHTYLPCYSLAVKDGHAVSLPGLRNEQGDYKKLFDTCKTAANDAASQAILMPISVNFYEWAMFTVEFATTNCQSIMQGCSELRHNNDDLIVMSSATEGIVQNHQAARVVGEYVSIQPSNVDINTYTLLASHRISSIIRCDQDGTPNRSGAYDHVTFEVIDNTRAIEAGTSYRFAARPYNTGSCNTVSTPSGSPVNNQNGYYPMKYRWRENVYGNQYQTVSDLMNFAVVEEGFTDANANYAAHLEWYYHRDPETLTPTNYANSTAGRDAMIAAGWELLDITTPAENYINGYVKSRDYSHKYPDVWKPGLTVGASTSTYYADYASLVYSLLLRAVRLGGYWNNGSNDGFSSANASNAPSYGYATYGGSLYYPQ